MSEDIERDINEPPTKPQKKTVCFLQNFITKWNK